MEDGADAFAFDDDDAADSGDRAPASPPTAGAGRAVGSPSTAGGSRGSEEGAGMSPMCGRGGGAAAGMSQGSSTATGSQGSPQSSTVDRWRGPRYGGGAAMGTAGSQGMGGGSRGSPLQRRRKRSRPLVRSGAAAVALGEERRRRERAAAAQREREGAAKTTEGRRQTAEGEATTKRAGEPRGEREGTAAAKPKRRRGPGGEGGPSVNFGAQTIGRDERERHGGRPAVPAAPSAAGPGRRRRFKRGHGKACANNDGGGDWGGGARARDAPSGEAGGGWTEEPSAGEWRLPETAAGEKDEEAPGGGLEEGKEEGGECSDGEGDERLAAPRSHMGHLGATRARPKMEWGTPPGTPTTQIQGALPVQQLSSHSGKTEGTEASLSAAGRERGLALAEAKHPKRTPQTDASAGSVNGECAPSQPSSAAASPRNSPSRTASRPAYASFAKTAGLARKRKHHPSNVRQSPDDLPSIALGGGRRSFRGARADAAAVAQGHGTHRLLVDELSYLCATLLQCRRGPGAASETATESTTTGSTAASRGGGGSGRPRAGTTGRDEATIRHTPLTAGAACDIAALLSRGDARAALATAHARAAERAHARAVGRGARAPQQAGPLDAVLACVACAPTAGGNGTSCREWLEGKEGEAAAEAVAPPSKDDAAASQALALLAYLVARDGTGSARGAVPAAHGRPHRRAAASAREAALRHGGMLRGVARLAADDPVVGAWMARGRVGSGGEEGEDGTGKSGCASQIQSPSPSMPSDSVSLPETDSQEAAPRDPTKRGRRGRRHRSAARPGPSQSSQPTGFEFSQESAQDSAASSASGRPEPPAGDRRADRLAAAAMRARLTEAAAPDPCLPNRSDAPACGACRAWMPRALPIDAPDGAKRCVPAAHLALMAADCLVSGRDRGSSDDEVEDDDDDDAGAFRGSDSDSNDDGASGPRPWAANPIAHANELLRRSGALPHYARAMAETLRALLLAADGPEEDDCQTCRAYLQRRASLLSEVIDGLCCLSPRASAALTHETSLLVPALLRTVAERSSVDGGAGRHEASSSAAVATALKTLTSLTHENRAACAQLLARRAWTSLSLPAASSPRGDSDAVTGVDVIFGCLFQTASARLAGGANAVDDDVIFCLNVLTNVVEMKPAPAKAALAALVLSGPSVGAAEAQGLAWLARWVVATTAGFRAAVLAGSFGAPAGDGAAPATNGSAVELPPGEEANLVTAGNGFVLLAYLLTDAAGGDGGDGARSDATAAAIRDAILAELPGSGGVRFAINTMKAFCNFYHFSVGDLSVAVIAPVVKLIRGLEAMAEEEEEEEKPA